MGEHAVLHGKQAIVMAVEKRLSVKLIPNDSQIISIADTRLGALDIALDSLQIQAPFTHVLQAICIFRDILPSGFNLEISSEFASDLGFGSSAAVTVATIAVLAAWLKPMELTDIFDLAQGLNSGGSGADIAASVYGGTLHYAMYDGVLQHLSEFPELTAVYCGYKTPTKDVLRIVDAKRAEAPQKYKDIYAQIQQCVSDAVPAIKAQDWAEVGKIFNRHHQLHVELGVSDNNLEDISTRLLQQQEILGAKISGAGLGDCVIGLGLLNNNLFAADKMQQFNLKNSKQGLVYEYN